MTLSLVQSVTVGAGGAASIDFTSIPQTSTDLLLVCSLRTAASGNITDNLQVRFNDDATSTYVVRYLQGTGAAANSSTFNNTSLIFRSLNGSAATASTFGNSHIYIPNYAGATQKSVSADNVTENNAATATMSIGAGLWPVTSAITKITIFSGSDTLAQYSQASLYMVTKGNGGASVS